MGLDVVVEKRQEGDFLVSLAGSIDSQSYLELESKLRPILVSTTKVLMLNMRDVSYISSMGISTILSAKKFIEQRNGTFIMTDLQPQIKLAFEIINALSNMRVFQSVAEADAYLTAVERKEIEKQQGKPKKL